MEWSARISQQLEISRGAGPSQVIPDPSRRTSGDSTHRAVGLKIDGRFRPGTLMGISQES